VFTLPEDPSAFINPLEVSEFGVINDHQQGFEVLVGQRVFIDLGLRITPIREFLKMKSAVGEHSNARGRDAEWKITFYVLDPDEKLRLGWRLCQRRERHCQKGNKGKTQSGAHEPTLVENEQWIKGISSDAVPCCCCEIQISLIDRAEAKKFLC